VEHGVSLHKLGHPLVGTLDHVHVDTVLEVFLLEGIREEVQACKVGERDEFGEGGALTLAKSCEQFEMQVADFLLGDRGQRVDWVKPDIDVGVRCQLVEASGSEPSLVSLRHQFLDKRCSLGNELRVLVAEVVDIDIELLFILCLGQTFLIGGQTGVNGQNKRVQILDNEVPSVEASRNLGTVCRNKEMVRSGAVGKAKTY